MAPVDDGYVDMDPVQRYHGEGEMRGELVVVFSVKEMVICHFSAAAHTTHMYFYCILLCDVSLAVKISIVTCYRHMHFVFKLNRSDLSEPLKTSK
jgi:hypothetical protein